MTEKETDILAEILKQFKTRLAEVTYLSLCSRLSYVFVDNCNKKSFLDRCGFSGYPRESQEVKAAIRSGPKPISAEIQRKWNERMRCE